MKKKAIVPGPRPPAGPLVIFDLHDRVPGMSDEGLGTLHTNALRLVQSGNERQRASATALMPVIEAELALREAKALLEKPVRKPRAPRKKAAAKSLPTVTSPVAASVPALPESETSGV